MSRSTYAGVMITAFVVTFFFMSFNDAPGSNDIKERIVSPGEALPGLTQLKGYMDTLYVDIPTFRRLAPKNRKLVFKYYITTGGKLTLYGWRTKKDNVNNHEYDPTNELILKNGGSKLTVPYGPGSFLGGVVITKDDVDTIREYIGKNPTMTFVMFEPQKDPTYAGHVYYEINLTDFEPKAGSVQTLVPPVKVIGAGANPSPPRNS